MIIKKFNKIKSAFSYSFFDWDKINFISFVDKKGNQKTRDGHLVKSNIIFAENGNGKTRLIDIMKSVGGQDVVLEKNWDRPATDEQEVQITLMDDSEITFDGNDWSKDDLEEKFFVFDEDFVETFVHSVGPHSEDTAQRRQQRGQNIVYLGNFAEYNDKIERVNALKNTISDKNNRFLGTAKAKIQGLLNQHDIDSDELDSKKENLRQLKQAGLKNKKEQLEKQQNELKKIKKALDERDKIDSLSLLSKIELTLSLEVEDKNGKQIKINPQKLFSFTISEGVKETLHKIVHKKHFIKQGVGLLKDETTECPFCEQKIKNGDYIKIIQDYREIFNEEFATQEQRTINLLLAYKNLLGDLRDLQPPTKNQEKLISIKPFITIKEELPQLALVSEDKAHIKEEVDLVSEKEKRPLEEMNGSQIVGIKKIIEKANKSIENYNKIVKTINKKVKQLKKDAKEGKLASKKAEVEKRLKKLKDEIFYLENKKIVENYLGAVSQHVENNKVIESLENIYQALKDKTVEKFDEFVTEYFGLIKQFIKEISPSMEILDIGGQATYDRRSIRNPAQCGFRIKYNGKDRSGSLSKGEKRVVALAFFFAHLRKEPDKEKIIVLDDPITSFDAGKRKSTAEVVQKETENFAQLFILTCDPLFREYCLKQFDNRNFYYIFKTRGASAIHYVPTRRETIYSAFEEDFKNIENVQGSNENVIIYGQKLRFCLETKIKEDYFGYSQDNLSNMIEQVASQGRDNLLKIIDDKEKILQIYNYCNTGGLAHYPKDGSTSWNELKDKIEQYLDLGL
jgi:wobble nucleotide-excising tRNase